MSKGVIYVMTTVVPGLIKIGRTQTSNYNSRMYTLESNGYANVTALKRKYAIEVEDYEEKEKLLHTIFSKSQVSSTELFATDVDTVVQLLSSFDGKQIYPEEMTKKQTFNQAVMNEKKETEASADAIVPNGIYTLKHEVRRDGITAEAKMEAKNGKFTVLAGGIAAISERDNLNAKVSALRSDYVDKNGKITEPVSFASPSAASSFVIGGQSNGWRSWMTENGKPIDVFRKRND